MPRTIISGIALAETAASVSLAIASQTPRRAYATIAVVAWFLVTWPIAGILVQTVGGGASAAVFFSPFEFMYGATLWIFGAEPGFETTLDVADFPLWTYAVAVVAYAAAGAALVLRRFDRIAA